LHLPRRTFLRGLGATVALPLLDAMLPAFADRRAFAADPAPRRLVFVYVPNGIIMDRWTPRRAGRDFDLPPTLAPLSALKSEISILTGLDLAPATASIAGDHARAAASFLTGAAAKPSESDLHAGVSADQFAAAALPQPTRLRSIELSCEDASTTGNCDSGYGCAYTSSISWNTATTPCPRETSPSGAFDRLFYGSGTRETPQERAKRVAYKKGVLDLVAADAQALGRRLGAGDRQKLDEYLTSVRELERRVVDDNTQNQCGGDARPTDAVHPYEERVGLMFDVLALGLRCDVTRVASLMLARELSDHSYVSLGLSEGHHSLSHHDGDANKIAALASINRWHVERLAAFLAKLQSTSEGDGNLLDHSMIVYGSGISDGNTHSHGDLPILLAGRGGGALRQGQHLRYAGQLPLSNLYVALLSALGLTVTSFGDSTGALSGIQA
jgi:hypothetical protein